MLTWSCTPCAAAGKAGADRNARDKARADLGTDRSLVKVSEW
jgi:hypothetical protein